MFLRGYAKKPLRSLFVTVIALVMGTVATSLLKLSMALTTTGQMILGGMTTSDVEATLRLPPLTP